MNTYLHADSPLKIQGIEESARLISGPGIAPIYLGTIPRQFLSEFCCAFRLMFGGQSLYRPANFTKVARAASTVLIDVSKSILNFRLSANISNPSLSIPVIATALTVVAFNTLQ